MVGINSKKSYLVYMPIYTDHYLLIPGMDVYSLNPPVLTCIYLYLYVAHINFNFRVV